MTSDSFTLSEFSEYLDDTDGHRLAQFLQKKSGAVRNGAKRIFDCEPQRFSLNVRLKRLSSPPDPTYVTEVRNECVIPETQDTDNEKDARNKEQAAELLEQEVMQQKVSKVNNTQQNATAYNASLPCMLPMRSRNSCRENKSMIISPAKSHAPQCTVGPVQVSIIAEQNKQTKGLQKPICPESVFSQRSEEPNLRGSECENNKSPTVLKPKTSTRIVPQTPRSLISKVSHSGGLRSGDRLRRQLLKRLSNIENNGRRTLLKEFESTLHSTDFSPPICSTPMHHIPAENLLKTPPRVNNLLNSPKTPEINVYIPNDEALQHINDNAVVQQELLEQPLIKNMVEALEETIKKLKSFQKPPTTRTDTSESSTNATELPQIQEQLQQDLVQASIGNEVNISKVLATEDLLQEVQKTLADLKNSTLKAPNIVIPVNQTFNNVPAAADKQISDKENNPACGSSKLAQQTQFDQTDQTITDAISRNNMHATFTHSPCMRQHTITESNLKEPINSNSPNNFINHPTFTHNNTAKTNPPIDSLQHNNATSRRSLRTWRQQTFTKQNTTHTDKVIDTVGNEHHKQEHSINPCKITSNIETFAKSTTQPTRELRSAINRNAFVATNKPNISGVNSTLLNTDHKRSTTPSAQTTFNNKILEVDLVKQQTIVNHNNSVAHASKCTTLNNRPEVSTETANKATKANRTLTEKSISMLLTDDEDEEDIHYAMNKRQILRKSGPLNLATEKAQTTKRSRRTIKRSKRTHLTIPRPFGSLSLTSDTETDAANGPPPAHPLNLQHVKPVEHKKIQQLRRRPLNKAPSTPKNGELFADELKAHLARLTNHEILDLRKRNSMGFMNGNRLRKSSVGMKQDLKDKLKIEEEIQLEILRRDLLGNSEGLHGEQYNEVVENREELSESEVPLANEVVEVIKEIIFDELPQAPAAFKDNTFVAAKATADNVDATVASVPPAFKDNTAVAADAFKDNTAVATAPLKDNTAVVAIASVDNDKAVVAATTSEVNVDAGVTPEVPEPFKDNAGVVAAPNPFNTNDTVDIMQQTVLQLTQQSYYNSSLIDDRFSGRVTFVSSKPNNAKNHTNERRSRRRSKKLQPLPEVTKKYFQLQENIKKRRKHSISKRSLYSKGDSVDEQSERSDNEKDTFRNISSLMEPIPPPPVVSPVSDIQIPSPPPPPPPLADLTVSTYMQPSLPAEELVLPPAPFSDKQMTKGSANGKTLTASQNNTTASQVACQTDDELFKKPTKLAPRTSRKQKTRDTSTYRSSNVNQTECTDDTEGIRRSKRGQVPRNVSFLTSKLNGHSLLESLFSNITKSKSSTRAKSKQANRPSSSTSSSSSIKSRGDDLNTPTASSTAHVTNVLKRGRKSKNTLLGQAQAFSYLGDTNVTSSTVYSQRNTEYDTFYIRLGAIEETPTETDDHETTVTSPMAAVVTPASSDKELPTTSTSTSNTSKNSKTTNKANKTATKANKKTAATKKQTTKAENKGRTRKAATEAKRKQQQQQQQQQKRKQVEIDTVEEALQAADDDTKNRTGLLECSRVHLPPPPSLEKLSEMFDELKNATNNSHEEATTSNGAESNTSTVGNAPVRPVRVRLRRLTARDTATATTTATATGNATGNATGTATATTTTTTTGTSSASSSVSNNESTQTTEGGRKELLAWLVNVTHLQSVTDKQPVFMDMRPSTAGKLFFTDLQGIDYAFYDTDDKCSLGYLRFKPLQSKPSKRAKKYHLHFVVLAGTFEISTERESGKFGVGDMVAINIGSRYEITNVENDIGILMVIKK